MPKVLLLGDSIRMSYQGAVAEALVDEAEVVGPQVNCQFTAFTLEHLDEWLEASGPPEIIHWNNGLHDAGHNPARTPEQVPLETYLANLEKILDRLEATGARVIFATSTPCAADHPVREDTWWFRDDEIDLYNRKAIEVMRRRGVPINDLWADVMADRGGYLSDDLLHLSDEGVRVCAEAVVRVIRIYLDDTIVMSKPV